MINAFILRCGSFRSLAPLISIAGGAMIVRDRLCRAADVSTAESQEARSSVVQVCACATARCLAVHRQRHPHEKSGQANLRNEYLERSAFYLLFQYPLTRRVQR